MKDHSLGDWIRRFDLLYGERNRYCIPAITDLCFHLNIAVKILRETITRDRGRLKPDQAIADVCGWVFAFSNYLSGLPLVEEMVKKYGAEICSYCHSHKCQCPKNRNQSSASSATRADSDRITTTLLEWQALLDRLYGQANRQNGVEFCLGRLGDEVSEMMENIRSFNVSSRHTVGERRVMIAKELADVLAWIFAVANVAGLTLEEALKDRYGKIYPECACREFICSCGSLIRRQDGFRTLDPLGVDNDDKADTVSVS